MRRPAVLIGFITLVYAAAAGDLSVELKDTKGAPIADAVVFLVPVEGTALAPSSTAPVVVSQSGQEFTPYVTAIQAGTRVAFPNRDTVKHHVYSLSKTKRFEIPLYGGESRDPILFETPGVVTLGCNIHDWMIAYVVVLPTPYFAKSDALGKVMVSTVPAGRYRYEIWHPRLASPVVSEITMTDAAMVLPSASLALKPDRRIRRAPDSTSNGYP